jgi:DUF2971 family protein
MGGDGISHGGSANFPKSIRSCCKLVLMPPERLFKYTTTEAASAILSNQSLRWSSPVAFNDPFDLKNYFHIDFSWSDLKSEVLQKLQEMICCPLEPSFADDNELVPTIRSWRTTLKGLARERVESELIRRLSQSFTLCENLAEKERRDWLQEKAIVRILCLAERPDNILMWSHYAGQHAGVVLEFRTGSLELSASSHAIKIRYSDDVPTPFTYEQILNWLLGQKAFPDVEGYTTAVASTKSTHWSYEQEWRFLRYTDHPEPGRYSDFAYPSDALIGVYFGSRTDSAKRDDLVSLLKGRYPHARMFSMREKSGHYDLEVVPT